jgi:hypothetical protein
MKGVPETRKVLEVVEEYEETVRLNEPLLRRARALRGLA